MAVLSATPLECLVRLLMSVVASVSILQTPIPMAHVHSEIESHGRLTAHLDRHHQGESVDGREFHWHLVLPCANHDGECPCSDGSPNPTALVSGGGQVSVIGCGERFSERLPQRVLDQLGTYGLSDRALSVPSAARCSLTSSQRTCALLCVIRC